MATFLVAFCVLATVLGVGSFVASRILSAMPPGVGGAQLHH